MEQGKKWGRLRAPSPAMIVALVALVVAMCGTAVAATLVSGDSIINIFIPFFIGLFFSIVVLSSGTYMLEAVTDEKENRTIEVMTTSLTPGAVATAPRKRTSAARFLIIQP